MAQLPPETTTITFQPGDAVLMVDPQNDFCPGGALGVNEGDAVMPILNHWSEAAETAGIPVFISRDWHPAHTTHFQAEGGIWPPHCIAGTPGAEFHPAFHLSPHATIVSKGMGAEEDAYSAFQARDAAGRPLAELLRQHAVQHLYVMGLATDYCVKESTLSALAAGLRVSVVHPGIRAVDLQPGDGERALQEMRAAGGEILEWASRRGD